MKESLKEHLNIEKYTIGNFEDIIKIMSASISMNEMDALDKIIDLLDYLKVPESEIDEIDAKDIADIVLHLKDDTKIDFSNTLDTIELNKRVYVATPIEDFKLKGRMISKVFNHINASDFPSYLLALVFKDDQLDVVEHLDESHIKYKQKLFKDLKFTSYYEYVIKAQIQVIEANKSMLEKQAVVNE